MDVISMGDLFLGDEDENWEEIWWWPWLPETACSDGVSLNIVIYPYE